MFQVTWKSKLKAAFPDPNAYSAFMGNFSTATGELTWSLCAVDISLCVFVVLYATANTDIPEW